MQRTVTISTIWEEPLAASRIHGRVAQLHKLLGEDPALLPCAGPGCSWRRYETRCRERYGVVLEFDRRTGDRPCSRAAYCLEARQIQNLGLEPLVLITNHDTMDGASLLRTLPTSRHIPMSVEWSVEFGQTVFHLGIHTLPSSLAARWMERFRALTTAPDDGQLLMTLRELHTEPQILTVLNPSAVGFACAWAGARNGAEAVSARSRTVRACAGAERAATRAGTREVARLARERDIC